MELKTYLNPLLRWWWLIALAALISSVSAFLVTRDQMPIYEAHTTLVIGRSVYEPNPSSTDLWMGQQLAAYYADLAQRDVVRNGTMQALGLEWLPQYIAVPLINSQLLEITVTDVAPLRAMAVANELANQLVQQTPANNQQGGEFAEEQLAKLEASIKETEAEIAKKESELQDLNSARQISELETEINALQEKNTRMQSTYATLIANTSSGAANTLSVIEPASLPQYPIGPNKKMTILLAGAVGMVMAVAAAYLLEYIDDSIRSAEEARRIFGAPVIGEIPRVVSEKEEGPQVGKYPRSPLAEAFRTLRTNIEFLSVDSPLETILVSSPDAAEGKSFISTNLSTSMVHAGKKTLLVDADLRNPSLHQYLGLENRVGLSDLLRGAVDPQGAIQTIEDGSLLVITSGSLPPNPTELLGSKRMGEILKDLFQDVDVIVLDGPPFIVADAAVLSAQVSGVLLVVRSGHTRRKRAASTLEQINRARGKILGVILNQLPHSNSEYYTYYGARDPEGRRTTTFLKLSKEVLKRLKESKLFNPANGQASDKHKQVREKHKQVRAGR